MEIVHIVLGKANPDRMNGVNKVVYQLATQQTAQGVDVSVWGIANDTEKNYGERNFKTRLFKKQKNPFTVPASLKQAILEMPKNTVFHIHGGWVPVFSSLAMLLKKHHFKYVLTPHGAYNTIAMQRNSFVKKIHFSLFEKQLIKNAKHIHCIGQSEVDGINKIVHNPKTFLLPYGFEMQNNKVFVNNSSQATDFIIGFVGRLDIYTKGLDLLLEAFAHFQKHVPNSKLWIVGDSSEKSKLMQMAVNIGISEHVVFFGSKFGDEKNSLIQQMHIFAHPSRNEGLPASVIEAAYFGVPCVVTNATNVGSYITQYKAGIAINNENVNELENAFLSIYELWKNSQIQPFKNNAMQMVNDVFGWEALIEKYNTMYFN